MNLKLIGLSSVAALLLSSPVLANTPPYQIVCASGASAAAVSANLNNQLAAIPYVVDVTNLSVLPVFNGSLGLCATVYSNKDNSK